MDFVKLLYKEIKGARWTTFLFIAVTLGWHLFLLSRTGVWKPEVYLPLSWVPLFVLPLWVTGNLLYMHHSEWNTNSIYLLLSLPVGSWKITGSKLLASIIDLVFLGIFSMLSIWIFFGDTIWNLITKYNPGISLKLLIEPGLVIASFYIIFVFVLLVVGQFAYIVGRFVNRFRGIVVGVISFLSLWIYMRVGAFITPIFELLPDISIKSWYTRNNILHFYNQDFNTAPFAALIFLAAVTFACSSWFFSRYIEV